MRKSCGHGVNVSLEYTPCSRPHRDASFPRTIARVIFPKAFNFNQYLDDPQSNQQRALLLIIRPERDGSVGTF